MMCPGALILLRVVILEQALKFHTHNTDLEHAKIITDLLVKKDDTLFTDQYKSPSTFPQIHTLNADMH